MAKKQVSGQYGLRSLGRCSLRAWLVQTRELAIGSLEAPYLWFTPEILKRLLVKCNEGLVNARAMLTSFQVCGGRLAQMNVV